MKQPPRYGLPLKGCRYMTIIRPVRGGDGKPTWDALPKENFPFRGDVALGNMTQYVVSAFMLDDGRLCVGVEGHGVYTFRSFVHWTYAAEKLNIQNQADASNLSDWINAQLGYADMGLQGSYLDGLVAPLPGDTVTPGGSV